MYISLIIVLLTSITIEFIFGSKLKNSKILGFGVHCFSIGLVLFLLTYFFGISTISLRYGIGPSSIAADKGIPAALLLSLFGGVLIVISWIIKISIKSGSD